MINTAQCYCTPFNVLHHKKQILVDGLDQPTHCRQAQRQWNIDLPDAGTSQGAQQILKCMHSFFELITQDQLPHFHQIQVRKTAHASYWDEPADVQD